MLGVSSYTQAYVDSVRDNLAAVHAAYKPVAAAAKAPVDKKTSGDTLETRFFNHLVLALEMYFVHRLRGKELKDGNPMNEVRMLAQSLMNNGGVLTADNTIKYKPESAVLKLKIGDAIRVTEEGFKALSAAFFKDLEKKFV